MRGFFDPELVPIAEFDDATATSLGWFDEDFVQAVEVTPLSWSPGYPNILRAATVYVLAGTFAAPFQPPAPTLPPLSWQPEYQDTLVQPRFAAPQSVFFVRVEPPAVPARSWAPVYPDKLDRRTLSTSAQQSTAYVPAIRRWGLDALPWLPVYPDTPGRRAAQILVALQQVVAYTPAVKNWGLDSGKIPWFVPPSQPRARSVQAQVPAPSIVFFAALPPITSPSSWSPVLRVARAALQGPIQDSRAVEPILVPAVVVGRMDWLPFYPSQLRRLVPQQPASFMMTTEPIIAPYGGGVAHYGRRHYWASPNPPYVS